MNILLIGDRILDVNYYCEAPRLCPEAPVPVLVKQRQETNEGGAALVEWNLKSLGLNVAPLYGSESEKLRLFVGSHLVTRIDNDSYTLERPFVFLSKVKAAIPQADAVVISDYCKGAITQQIAHECVSSGKPCFVDTKNSHIEWFYGGNVTLFPNRQEYEAHVRGKEGNFGTVIEKRGHDGCRIWRGNYGSQSIPAERRVVADVTGAGDVFLAAFVWGWSKGYDVDECARIANHAAGISVEHVGTYITKPADVEQLALAEAT